ncbi:MAG: thioredoxin domain-containing protein [Phycisphaerales bacterium]|nr:thioredoxin domain-containing protein [Phycisphaerales bacterium]
MARKKQPIAARNLTNPATRAATFAQREQPSGLMWFGMVALLAAVALMAMLSLEKLAGLSLPGCGAGSPCAQAQASAWGRVPGINWPISYLGLAYFAALMPAWWLTGRRVVNWLQGVIFLGGAISIVYLIVIFSKGLPCPYCLGAHAANLMLCGATWLRGATNVPLSAAALPSAAGVFIGASALLGITDALTRQKIDKDNTQLVDESVEEMLRRQRDQQTTTKPAPVTRPTDATTKTAPTQPSSSKPIELSPPETQGKPFVGRWRRGPDPAPVRIVMYFDFQCKDCQRIEAEIESLLTTRNDISFSPKHFPMNTACNPGAPNLHNNACWAARAAEAAGIVGGVDGFWKMHAWLVKQKGSFTNDELKAGLAEMGFDAAQFVQVLQGPQTEANVKADIQEAIELGLYFTPMIFINGVELKGWNAPNAVTRVVDRLTAAGVTPAPIAGDRLPTASQKYVDDWREWPRVNIPPPSKNWSRGPADAAVRIVVFGDYQEPNTRDLHNELTRLTAARDDVSIQFRYFPFNKDCNPGVPANKFPAACVAARAAEAAGALGGPAGFQQMHAWLFANQGQLSEEFIRANVASLNIDPEKFAAAWNAPETAARIAEDIAASKRANLTGIPAIYINERSVPRWRRENDNILERIINEAAAGR